MDSRRLPLRETLLHQSAVVPSDMQTLCECALMFAGFAAFTISFGSYPPRVTKGGHSSHDLLRTSALFMPAFSQADHLGPYRPGGMAARAVSREVRAAFAVHDRLRHDGTGGVADAKEQDLVVRHEKTHGGKAGN